MISKASVKILNKPYQVLAGCVWKTLGCKTVISIILDKKRILEL